MSFARSSCGFRGTGYPTPAAMNAPAARTNPEEDCAGSTVSCASGSLPAYAAALISLAAVGMLAAAAFLVYRHRKNNVAVK